MVEIVYGVNCFKVYVFLKHTGLITPTSMNQFVPSSTFFLVLVGTLCLLATSLESVPMICYHDDPYCNANVSTEGDIFVLRCGGYGAINQIPPVCEASGVISSFILDPTTTQVVRLQQGAFYGLRIVELTLSTLGITLLDTDAFLGLGGYVQAIELSNNRLTELLFGTFSSLRVLNILNLQNNRLTSLNATIFNDLMSLTFLNIANNAISSIDPKTFFMTISLQYLHVQNNLVQNISDMVFSTLAALEYLDLSNNRIGTVSSTMFSTTEQLLTLNLSGNIIETLPENLFVSCQSLQSVQLSNNHISTISISFIRGLSNLRTLMLDYNFLTVIPEYVFTGLSSMSILNLTANKISYLKSNSFSGLPYLTELYIRQNEVTTIPQGLFDPLGALLTLDFSNNKISLVQPNPFEALSQVTTIDLTGNYLSQIRNDWFSANTALTTVRLANNQITTVDQGAFQAVPTSNLAELDLRNNSLSFNSLHGIFLGCTQLQTLKLCGNPLWTVNGSVFKNLTSLTKLFLTRCCLLNVTFHEPMYLEELYLENNFIEYLHSGDLLGLSELSILDLGSNVLQLIDSGAISLLSNLKVLNLTDNNLHNEVVTTTSPQLTAPSVIVDLSWNMLTNMNNLQRFAKVYLSGNPLNCSCIDNITWILNDSILSMTWGDYNTTTCRNGAQEEVNVVCYFLNATLCTNDVNQILPKSDNYICDIGRVLERPSRYAEQLQCGLVSSTPKITTTPIIDYTTLIWISTTQSTTLTSTIQTTLSTSSAQSTSFTNTPQYSSMLQTSQLTSINQSTQSTLLNSLREITALTSSTPSNQISNLIKFITSTTIPTLITSTNKRIQLDSTTQPTVVSSMAQPSTNTNSNQYISWKNVVQSRTMTSIPQFTSFTTKTKSILISNTTQISLSNKTQIGTIPDSTLLSSTETIILSSAINNMRKSLMSMTQSIPITSTATEDTMLHNETQSTPIVVALPITESIQSVTLTNVAKLTLMTSLNNVSLKTKMTESNPVINETQITTTVSRTQFTPKSNTASGTQETSVINFTQFTQITNSSQNLTLSDSAQSTTMTNKLQSMSFTNPSISQMRTSPSIQIDGISQSSQLFKTIRSTMFTKTTIAEQNTLNIQTASAPLISTDTRRGETSTFIITKSTNRTNISLTESFPETNDTITSVEPLHQLNISLLKNFSFPTELPPASSVVSRTSLTEFINLNPLLQKTITAATKPDFTTSPIVTDANTMKNGNSIISFLRTKLNPTTITSDGIHFKPSSQLTNITVTCTNWSLAVSWSVMGVDGGIVEITVNKTNNSGQLLSNAMLPHYKFTSAHITDRSTKFILKSGGTYIVCITLLSTNDFTTTISKITESPSRQPYMFLNLTAQSFDSSTSTPEEIATDVLETSANTLCENITVLPIECDCTTQTWPQCIQEAKFSNGVLTVCLVTDTESTLFIIAATVGAGGGFLLLVVLVVMVVVTTFRTREANRKDKLGENKSKLFIETLPRKNETQILSICILDD